MTGKGRVGEVTACVTPFGKRSNGRVTSGESADRIDTCIRWYAPTEYKQLGDYFER